MKMTFATTLILLGALVSLPASAGGRGVNGPGGGGQNPVPLSPAEEETLVFMREEEKMARDVYLVLFDEWGLPVFDNISQSEQRHMDAMKDQLDKYGIADPVVDDTVGVFENEELAQLYGKLVEQGMESAEQALRVGALIEIVDILDLKDAIAESSHADVTRAYENLMRGSRNHLRAFVRQLESRGVVYEAVIMDQEELDAIVDSPMERGGRKGGKGSDCKGQGCRF